MSRGALAAAAATPLVVGVDTAGDHRPVVLDPLTDRDQAKADEAAEGGQINSSEGSVEHVVVPEMGGVGTSIMETPSLSPSPPSSPRHDLDCEGPVKVGDVYIERGTCTAAAGRRERAVSRSGR